MGRGLMGGRVVLLIFGLTAILFAYRAVWGWAGGVAYVKGKYRVENGLYKEAIPVLDRGALGGRKATALWLRGLAHFSLWQEMVATRQPVEETNPVLVRAHQDFTAAMALSPATGWYPTELAQLYHMWDGLPRLEQGNLLSLIGRDKWAYVGHQGRVAVGLARDGIEREPSYFIFYDKLALMLLNYELPEPALDVVRESARVQPLYTVHDWGNTRYVPPPILDAFAEGSREALGKLPMMSRGKHLIALGRIEYLRGNYAQAETDLREALEFAGDSLNRADTHQHLGMSLAKQGRLDEALDYLDKAKEHERTRIWATQAEARVLVEAGRQDEGIEAYRRLRQLDPGNIEFALEFAGVTHRLGRYDDAIEALRQVTTIARDDERGYRRLIAVHMDRGDARSAKEALDLLERRTGKRPADLDRAVTAGPARSLADL